MRLIKGLVIRSLLSIAIVLSSASFPIFFLNTSANAASVNCTNKTTFLGLPSWYEFLDVTDDGTGNGCSVRAPQDKSILVLIMLAIIDILLKLAALIAVVFVVYGGFRFTTAQGSPEGVASGKKTILNAIIGLVIAVLASQIVKFVAHLLSK